MMMMTIQNQMSLALAGKVFGGANGA